MALQIVLNVILAITWMFLNGDWSFTGLIVGYGIGLILVIAMRRFFTQRLYIDRVWACIKLLFLFIKELILSNIAVIRQVLRPKLNIRPGIIDMRTELTSDLEITLLTSLITLTPGTLSLEVSEDQRTIYIHAMDIEDAEQLAQDIKLSFERAIMEVTR